ncbi:MAG: prolipoprotein diacylglyceryl transferase [Oscillospiraceae bacterium]|nr:prolipoprotein diacylglyceryl transferase [Oscillospiraceae bacterium]
MNSIDFPKIGLSFNINPVAFTIGSKNIYWYALIILTGFALGLLFVYRTCEKRGVKKDNIWDIALFGLIFGIIGARIYYVIFALDEFSSPAEYFKIWNGGLAIYGGIIGAIISSYIYCRIKKLNAPLVFDVCAPGLLIGQAIGRFGNFVNCEVYGGETDSILGMSINGASPVHPVFLYESLWNIAGLIILLLFREKKHSDGQIFCFYIFWYSLGRFFLEGIRDPQYILWLVPGIIGISQAVALAAMLVSIVLFVVFSRKRRKNGKA